VRSLCVPHPIPRPTSSDVPDDTPLAPGPFVPVVPAQRTARRPALGLCVRCENQLSLVDRFCGQCGHAVGADPQAPAAGASAGSAHQPADPDRHGVHPPLQRAPAEAMPPRPGEREGRDHGTEQRDPLLLGGLGETGGHRDELADVDRQRQ
jgi:hypothetical protein